MEVGVLGNALDHRVRTRPAQLHHAGGGSSQRPRSKPVTEVLTPQTYADNILYRRAQRLRKLTGNPHIRAEAELGSHELHLGQLVVEAIYRPIQMTFKEPIIIAVNLYIG